MSSETTVNSGVRVLDLNFQGREGAIAAFLLIGDQDVSLIETGPSTTIEFLLAGLAECGIAPERVTKLLLTHIHLDHAGAAGVLTRMLPNAMVYVHEVGAPHMVDPGKLISSATRIYRDDMDRLWGEIAPVPEDRLVVLRDGESMRAGDRTLQALYTPGHASHHIAYWDAESREVFTGDVGGVRVPGTLPPLPPTPPPDLDLDSWSRSLQRLMDLRPTRLYLTHFGPFDDPARHLEELHRRLYEWADLMRGGIRDGLSKAGLVALLEEHADREMLATVEDPEALARVRLVSGYEMNVMGFLRYFKTKGEPVPER